MKQFVFLPLIFIISLSFGMEIIKEKRTRERAIYLILSINSISNKTLETILLLRNNNSDREIVQQVV